MLTNIISPPNPAQALKYRQLRLSNKLVSREIVAPANGAARDYLVLCGFRREVREFEEMLVWKQSEGGKQLFKLRCGRKVVEDRIKLAKEAEERETRYRESEKEAEQGEFSVSGGRNSGVGGAAQGSDTGINFRPQLARPKLFSVSKTIASTALNAMKEVRRVSGLHPIPNTSKD